jgi:predicted NBD/HSP70 family sugar kinase
MVESHPNLIFEGIGISVPGRFDESRQRVVFAPNLHWPQFDLKVPLEQATGLPVELENAANACVLAEVWFGHGEKTRDLTVVTVSEGLGVGIFVEGRLVRGLNGMAGEFGHVPLDIEGPGCSCGGRGCWEVYASNRAALRYYHESGAASGLGFDELLELAEGGDSRALDSLDRMAHAIGRGTRMIVAGIAPEEIVFVGEFTKMWNRFGPIIAAEVAASVLAGPPPRVRPAAAQPSSARLRGAVALVLQKHFGPSATVEKRRSLRSSRRAKARV